MDFEVYCDENHPELFTSQKPTADYLMIGSLWLPAELRNDVKTKIWQLREQYSIWGEIKWRKVSNRSLDFYKSVLEKATKIEFAADLLRWLSWQKPR